MLNDRQLDIVERTALNSANIVWATFILGNALNPKGFNLIFFIVGCMLFLGFFGFALWLRRSRYS